MNKVKHPLLMYFLLVFIIAWGALIIVVGPEGLNGEAAPETWQLLPVFGAMLLGPAGAGLLLTFLTRGKRGLQDLWKKQRKYRVDLCWYCIALFTTPLLLLIILVPLSIYSNKFVPSLFATDNIGEVVVLGLIFGIFAGLFEEIGWTGFALKRLRKRYSLLLSGLILGFIWGAWHGMADYWGAHADFTTLWLPRIVLWTLALTAYRMLMTWVHENTESLLLAQLMHASFTGSQGLLVPELSRYDHFIWYSIFTLVLWLIVLILIIYMKSKIKRRKSRQDNHSFRTDF